MLYEVITNQNDGHERLYGFADNVIVNSENGPHYTNIWDFISGTAGVSVSGNTVSIRGADEPLFLLDGIQIDKDMVDAISMEEVDKVEILKNAGNLAIFGIRITSYNVCYTKLLRTCIQYYMQILMSW